MIYCDYYVTKAKIRIYRKTEKNKSRNLPGVLGKNHCKERKDCLLVNTRWIMIDFKVKLVLTQRHINKDCMFRKR